MSDKKATREALGETLLELVAEGRDDIVVLDADLAKATTTAKFAAVHPERFFDVGIAEEHAVGFSAGLARGGVAHWHVTYQVTSDELFKIWAASTGTNVVARKPGDPLPRLALDGVAVVEFDDAGLARHFRLWWHSVAL